VSENRDTECRPIGIIGECGRAINAITLQECIWDLEKENARGPNITCCFEDVLYYVLCYDRPKFEPVNRDYYYEILQTDELLLEEMLVLSKTMGCRLETDTTPNMEPYKHFVDEELIIAIDHFFEVTHTTERSLLEELQKEIEDIPKDFLTKVRQPAGLKMGASYRTPALNWLQEETQKKIKLLKNTSMSDDGPWWFGLL